MTDAGAGDDSDLGLLIQRLRQCTFLPGSWEKRFVRSLADKQPPYQLTPKQREWLGKLAHRYRKQLAGIK